MDSANGSRRNGFMIPRYPHTVALTEDVLTELAEASTWIGMYSDLDTASLWAWNDGSVRLTRMGGNIAVRMPTYNPHDEPTWSIVGDDQVAVWAKELLSSPRCDQLEFVPEPVAVVLSRDRELVVLEDARNFDHVLDIEQFLDASGPRYEKIRGHRRAGSRLGLNRLDVEVESPEFRELVDVVDQRWQDRTRRPADDFACERAACARLLDGHGNFELVGIGLVDLVGAPVAYAICSLPSCAGCRCAIAHFSKSGANHRGTTAILWQRTAEVLLRANRCLLNLEQDVGVEGIRRWKVGQNPIDVRRKFVVRLRDRALLRPRCTAGPEHVDESGSA